MRFKFNGFKSCVAVLSLTALQTSFSSLKAAGIDVENSSIAVLTDKEGIAAALAHRHIIVASSWNADLTLSKDDSQGQLEGTASINLDVKKLIVDTPKSSEKITSLFIKNKLWDEKVDKLEPGNSETVRENMLDKSQLDADGSPVLSGKGSFKSCKKVESNSSQCQLKIVMKIKNVEVEKQTALLITEVGNELVADFIVPYKFTDFGIKPYRAMMGAIGVKDEFFVGVHLKSQK